MWDFVFHYSGDEDAENPPGQSSGSKKSPKASVSKWPKDHVRRARDAIHQLIKKLNEKANKIGLDTRSMDKFLCDISALGSNKLKILFSFYKHIGRPIYARMTEMTKLPKRTLDDVEGVEYAKAELREVFAKHIIYIYIYIYIYRKDQTRIWSK